VAPPALPENATVVCPACPENQVCGACPVGTVATTRRRSLLGFLPSWMFGGDDKSTAGADSSDSSPPSSGLLTRYVVGESSTLPRSVGGPTVFLSATPCTLCGREESSN
jgi:hypothetical protein